MEDTARPLPPPCVIAGETRPERRRKRNDDRTDALSKRAPTPRAKPTKKHRVIFDQRRLWSGPLNADATWANPVSLWRN
jgi:hypothetical protein